MDDHIRNAHCGDLLHPNAEPLGRGKPNLHQIAGSWAIMVRVNDPYDPDAALYPTSTDHILHHAGERGVPYMRS